MLFNSYIFILLFLPVSVTGWFLLNKLKSPYISKAFLLGMSLWFYAYFNIKYLPIIIISIILNYLLYRVLASTDKKVIRKSLFVFGIVFNIAVLFYYKYLGFFTENLNALFKSDFNVVKLVLPLGISFFTFQQVSFIIDSYKNDVPGYSFIDYALFVCFFPQLIAGPIVLHDEIIPQFAAPENKKINWENFSKGIYAFSFGLAKKVLVADTIGNFANVGFENIDGMNTTTAVLSMLAYTFQIYYDFSGYCDMATGIGYMFNIKLPMNFNSPYKALDMEDFWKRWHITLTRFLTKNLYIPLGGNRKGKLRTYINTFIVFLISGLWHGANWTFVVWGAINGFLVILSKRFSEHTKFIKKKAPIILWVPTFSCINLLWVFFRADSVKSAIEILKKVFSFNFGGIDKIYMDSLISSEISLSRRIIEKIIPEFNVFSPYVFFVGLFLLSLIFCTFSKNTNQRIEKYKPDVGKLMISVLLVVWSVISFSGVSTFLYFNF